MFLQLPSEMFLILRRIRRSMTKNAYWSSRKVHVILLSLFLFIQLMHIYNALKECQNLH